MGYTGHAMDSKSGLHYSVHRYLDSRNGRLTRRDPAGMIDSVNRTSYVGNSPIQWQDPHGWYRTDFGETRIKKFHTFHKGWIHCNFSISPGASGDASVWTG